ncbi:MAG: diguanylate cyclase [Candidatus Omnitrophica bacterium]|nr:diguanylate cyclase [Candidatus Omnitrophota bacterium]
MNIFKRVSLVNKGLRYKLLLAFSLMSVIPLLACVYVISLYVFPQLDSLASVSVIVVVSIFIALLGLFLARSLVDPVIDMAIEANMIASGHYDKNLTVATDDEVGNLAVSINTMTQKIKTNLDELKTYGLKMKEINSDVHKKVLALSSLLQIGDVISAGSIQLEPLLEMTVEKAAGIFESSFGILYLAKDDESDFLPKIEYGEDVGPLREIIVKRKGQGLLDKVIENRSVLIFDSSVRLSKDMEGFKAIYNIKNILAIPIYSGRRNFGIMVIGSNLEDYKYKNDDVELLKVFAKQLTIAIESDLLNKKADELAIKDELTDLYNKKFILNRLGEEIRRAIFYQRPCSFVIFGIDSFDTFRTAHGELIAEEVLKKVSKVIKDNMVPVGKAARIAGDEFAVLLPEKNKKEAFSLAEEIRKKVEGASFLKSGNGNLTVSGGVSENPLDGATSEELYKRAGDLLREARNTGKNKVIM